MTASISRAPANGAKVLYAPEGADVLDRLAKTFGDNRKMPSRIVADPENVERDLARLVLSVIELLRQVIEKQAIRRVESGALGDDEIERLGQTLMALEKRMSELKAVFGLDDRELALDLGSLRDLM